jgi:hypothetical protein
MNIHGLNKGEFDTQIEPKEGYQTQIQKDRINERINLKKRKRRYSISLILI